VVGLPIANADIWFHCREMCFQRKLAEMAKAGRSEFILCVRRGLSLALLGRGPSTTPCGGEGDELLHA